MRNGVHLITVVVAAAIGAVLAVAAMPVAGQTPAYRAPRAADGKPDLNGIWQAVNEANYDIQAHVARPAMAVRPGPYGPVPALPVIALGAVGAVPPGLGVVEGNELPYQPGALAKKQGNYANRQTLDTEAKCFLPGVPRIVYMPFPFRIVQTPGVVMMLFEYLHATRNIFMDKPHPRGPIEWWMGDSRGRWEGDTLVVDVVHFNDQTWFDRAGNFHSEALHLVERYTLMDSDHLSYTATIEDPKVFTRPFRINMVLYRNREPNFQLLDYECYAFALDEEPIAPPGERR